MASNLLLCAPRGEAWKLKKGGEMKDSVPMSLFILPGLKRDCGEET
jgi:hypothetical protein